eukprot:s4624_g4.t1
MGIYKVCWCGGDGDCSTDEHFAMHVATLIINGIMLTVVGDGRAPNRTTDMEGVRGQSAVGAKDGAPGFQSPLGDPFGIAVSNQRVFFTERATHMLRWLDIEEGRVHTLAGQFFPGVRGDFGSAFNAQLSTPLGLALNRDHTSIYIADFGSDRVRKIDLTQDPLNRGIIETVAGNGFRGFSGDGGPAREAQLNGPSGVAVDLSWTQPFFGLNEVVSAAAFSVGGDSGNNVLRVVSMEIPVRIPGSNEFQANVILTAAGGSTGQSQGKGDGGVAWLARMQGPSGVAVSSAFVSNEDPTLDGTLPVNVYISESMGQQVRSMSLEFQSYLGVINTLAGSGQRGSDLQEAAPLEAPNAELNEPSGVATDAGLVYLSDSANNRLLMMPALEYVSMGCWRENIESPWIPSIEGLSAFFEPNQDEVQLVEEVEVSTIQADQKATRPLHKASPLGREWNPGPPVLESPAFSLEDGFGPDALNAQPRSNPPAPPSAPPQPVPSPTPGVDPKETIGVQNGPGKLLSKRLRSAGAASGSEAPAYGIPGNIPAGSLSPPRGRVVLSRTGIRALKAEADRRWKEAEEVGIGPFPHPVNEPRPLLSHFYGIPENVADMWDSVSAAVNIPGHLLRALGNPSGLTWDSVSAAVNIPGHLLRALGNPSGLTGGAMGPPGIPRPSEVRKEKQPGTSGWTKLGLGKVLPRVEDFGLRAKQAHSGVHASACGGARVPNNFESSNSTS